MSEVKKKIGVGIGVMIMRDNKILLGQRHPDEEKAGSALKGQGTWTMPGGKLEWGESFEDGATREVKEETGLDVKNLQVLCVNNDKNEHAHFITVGLIATEFEGEAQVCEPEVIREWKWFDLDKLPEPLFFPSKRVLDNYTQKAFYLKQ